MTASVTRLPVPPTPVVLDGLCPLCGADLEVQAIGTRDRHHEGRPVHVCWSCDCVFIDRPAQYQLPGTDHHHDDDTWHQRRDLA